MPGSTSTAADGAAGDPAGDGDGVAKVVGDRLAPGLADIGSIDIVE